MGDVWLPYIGMRSIGLRPDAHHPAATTLSTEEFGMRYGLAGMKKVTAHSEKEGFIVTVKGENAIIASDEPLQQYRLRNGV